MNFSWPLEQGLLLLFVWGCLHFLHNSQFNPTSGLGTLRTWRRRKSYICSSSSKLGQTGYQIRLFQKKRAGSQIPAAFGGPRPQAAPAPAPRPCFLLPRPGLWTARLSLSPAATPFTGLGRHRRAASGCRATACSAAHAAARAETHPHQPVCAASLWPDFSPSIVVAHTKGYHSSVAMGPALNYAPGYSLGQSLCGLRCVPSRSQNSGPVTRKLRRFQAWASLPPSRHRHCIHPPPAFVAFSWRPGPRLPLGCYEITSAAVLDIPPHSLPFLSS